MQKMMQLFSAGLVIVSAAGCAMTPNPFRDDLPPTASVTTASADRIRAQNSGPGAQAHRDWSEGVISPQDQGTAHWPIWWEDFMEDSGSNDGRFAWTWVDYVAVAYCPSRQALNTAGLPVSVIVDPIWASKCSDGRISHQTFGFRNHDSLACSGDSVLPDVVEAYNPTLPEPVVMDTAPDATEPATDEHTPPPADH
ncbi:MAG: hypothetical protein HJJLKODD_01165 [Phycisphaerae bacterium]|nr:hypothetical protein [Phycisphaerae bacterium]